MFTNKTGVSCKITDRPFGSHNNDFCSKSSPCFINVLLFRSTGRSKSLHLQKNYTFPKGNNVHYTNIYSLPLVKERNAAFGIFLPVIFGIWAQSCGGGRRELKLPAGAGFRVFMGLRFGIRKGTQWDTGFQSLFSRGSETLEFAPPFLSHFCFASSTIGATSKINWPAQKPQAGGMDNKRNETIVRIAVRAGMPSFGNKCSEPNFQRTWWRWKLWNKLSRVFTGHLLNMGISNLSFTDTWTKEKKTASNLTVYRKKWLSFVPLFICYPLNYFVIFYAMSIFF